MKIVYMGTSEFAVPPLTALAESGYKVSLVVTKEDTPKGRGGKPGISPVKAAAQSLSLPIAQPMTLRNNEEFFEILKAAEPDVIVVASYGHILPEEILSIPPLGCINIHASLLPEYRGAAPIQRAVLDGRKVVGVTLMYMDEGLDTGDMIAKSSTCAEGKTAAELETELSELGANLLLEQLPLIVSGDAERVPQDDSESTYAPAVEKVEGQIDFDMSAKEICCLVRAFAERPGAYTFMDGRRVKIFEVEACEGKVDHAGSDCGQSREGDEASCPGTVVSVGKEGIRVNCGEGCILIKKLQLPGRKPVDAADYILGNKIEIGTRLG